MYECMSVCISVYILTNVYLVKGNFYVSNFSHPFINSSLFPSLQFSLSLSLSLSNTLMNMCHVSHITSFTFFSILMTEAKGFGCGADYNQYCRLVVGWCLLLTREHILSEVTSVFLLSDWHTPGPHLTPHTSPPQYSQHLPTVWFSIRQIYDL